jgi:hypothetical protein
MPKIRIQQPTTVRLDLAPGDEITVKAMTPQLEQLLASRRLDNELVAKLVDGEERADLDRSGLETGTVAAGAGRRGQGRAPVS